MKSKIERIDLWKRGKLELGSPEGRHQPIIQLIDEKGEASLLQRGILQKRDLKTEMEVDIMIVTRSQGEHLINDESKWLDFRGYRDRMPWQKTKILIVNIETFSKPFDHSFLEAYKFANWVASWWGTSGTFVVDWSLKEEEWHKIARELEKELIYKKNEFSILQWIDSLASAHKGQVLLCYDRAANPGKGDENFWKVEVEKKNDESSRFGDRVDKSDWFQGMESQKSINAGSSRYQFEVKIPAFTPPSRFLQAAILSDSENPRISDHMLVDHSYKIGIRIGQMDKDWLQDTVQFPSEEVFTRRHEFSVEIQILLVANLLDAPQFQVVSLPRFGESTNAYFSIETFGNQTQFEGVIYAYHENRMIQMAILRSDILSSEGRKGDYAPAKLTVEFCIRSRMNNLRVRTPFDASFCFADIPVQKNDNVVAVNKGMHIDLPFGSGLSELLTKIHDTIEIAMIADHPQDLSDLENVKLLRKLALHGNSLFVNHLQGFGGFLGSVQIISNRPEFVPLDFVYTLPAPTLEAGLCEHAITALEAGECAKCFDHAESPAPHICPFGFWSLSKIVERHSFALNGLNTPIDYSLVAEPSEGRNVIPVFGTTVFASTEKLDAVRSGVRDVVRKAISKVATRAIEAMDWGVWRSEVKRLKPDSLVLLLHIEKDAEYDVLQLEIGKGNMLIMNHLDQKMINSGSEDHPFVIAIGCESTDIKNFGFDLSSQLMNQGAAVVLSCFSKIRGRDLGEIITLLSDMLAEIKSPVPLGQIVLRLRQKLIARGIMVGLSLVAHGDADWKIKYS